MPTRPLKSDLPPKGEVDLSDLSAAFVRVGGTRLRIEDDGAPNGTARVHIASRKPVEVVWGDEEALSPPRPALRSVPPPAAPVVVQFPVPSVPAEPQIGERVKEGPNEGWIYAGLSQDPMSPVYKKPLLVAPEDEKGAMSNHDACQLELGAKGQKRLPTGVELNQIFNAASSAKDRSSFGLSGEYWAAPDHALFQHAPTQRFPGGWRGQRSRCDTALVRFVR